MVPPNMRVDRTKPPIGVNVSICPAVPAGIIVNTEPRKGDGSPGELVAPERFAPQEQADRDRPERHRISEHDCSTGRQYRQADDAANDDDVLSAGRCMGLSNDSGRRLHENDVRSGLGLRQIMLWMLRTAGPTCNRDADSMARGISNATRMLAVGDIGPVPRLC
jgi:hypothetical protein